MVTRRVNQKGAQAGGDLVGGHKVEYHYHPAAAPPGIVEQLLNRLRAEMEQNEQVRHTIESLAHFQTRRSYDGIDGLENKLIAGGLSHEYPDAMAKKELFAKLLEQWSLYASAQEIFAFLLAKADYEFNRFIYPKMASLDQFEINEQIDSRIVTPIMTECASSVFTLNHSIVMGMLYWLAEQCFVRWHR
jgi:hypothetical protein